MPPPVRAKLGITYDHLAHLNDRLIYASFTGYGEKGEEANKPGFDSNAYWARSGLMDLVRADTETTPARSVAGMTYQLPEAPPPPKLPPPPLKLPLSLLDEPLLQPPPALPLDQEPPRDDRVLGAIAENRSAMNPMMKPTTPRAMASSQRPALQRS